MGRFSLSRLFLYIPWLIIVIGGTVSFLKIESFQNQLSVRQNQLRVQQSTTSAFLSKKLIANTEQIKEQQSLTHSLTSSILSKKLKTDKDSNLTKAVVFSKLSKTEEGLQSLKSEVFNQAILKQCVVESRLYGYLKELTHILVTDNAHSGSNLLAKQGRDTLHAYYYEISSAQELLKCGDRRTL
jgi:hypothetical protein